METRQFEIRLNFRGKDYEARVDFNVRDQEFIVSLPSQPYLHWLGYFVYRNGKWKNKPFSHKDQTFLLTQAEVNVIGSKILDYCKEQGYII